MRWASFYLSLWSFKFFEIVDLKNMHNFNAFNKDFQHVLKNDLYQFFSNHIVGRTFTQDISGCVDWKPEPIKSKDIPAPIPCPFTLCRPTIPFQVNLGRGNLELMLSSGNK